MLILAGPVLAQEPPPAAANGPADLLAAALIVFLPLGLILLTSSAMPEAEAPAMAIILLLSWGLAVLAYFAVGFAFQFGGIAQVVSDPDLRGLYWEWYPLDQSVAVELARQWGVIALQGWGLAGPAATPGALRLFLSHASLIGVAAMIPVASLPAGRRGVTAGLVALLTGGLIYPLAGNWLWGGGWLASLGTSLGLGHGLVDFGGSSVIFLTAGVVTLVALLVLNPSSGPERPVASPEMVVSTGLESRLTVYEDPPADEVELPAAPPMPPAYLPILSMLGGGLMLLGWFGLATGIHAPTAVNFSPAQAAVNGLLGALSAALAAAGYSWFTTRELNPLMTGRGLAAGLVISMAGAPFIPAWQIVLAGLATGLLLPSLIYLFDHKLSLADRLGAVATFGLSAVVGLLLAGILADGRAGQGWNGAGPAGDLGVAGQGVSGLAVASGFAPDPGQLHAQLVGLGAIGLWAVLVSLLLFHTVKAVATAWTRSGLELAGGPLAEPDRESSRASSLEQPASSAPAQPEAKGQEQE
jgi:Amt family ammonium transporter